VSVAIEQTGPQVLSILTRMEQDTQVALELIPTLLDSELVQLLHVSNLAAKKAWIIRGAVAFEIEKRAEDQARNRGEVESMFADVARESQVAVATIKDDARTVRVFGLEALRADTGIEREYWRAAASAEDPYAAIEMVQVKRDRNEPYSIPAFRADLQSIKCGMPADEAESRMRINRLLSEETSKALLRYLARSGKPLGDVVDEALNEFLKGNSQ
jgi:hypothetical protein